MRSKTLRMIRAGVINIDGILQLPADCRDPKQQSHMATYLQEHVSFFDSYPKDFMLGICRVMEFEKYDRGDILMRKGEKGDKMYISLRGRLGIYLGSSEEILTRDPIATLNAFAVVGDKAL